MMADPQITMIDLVEDETGLIEQLAHMTHAAFQAHAPGWLPTIQDARDEVLESLEPKKISRVLIDESRQPLGWIAATPHSGGRVWEIHPVAVAPAAQGRGYGRILIADIEQLAQTAGALTLLVGTGDATDATTLSGVDLYADPATAIAGIRALRATLFVLCAAGIYGRGHCAGCRWDWKAWNHACQTGASRPGYG
ncbi:MAG: GNAT family N-acetyltransferase [Caldilineaceae bacterium]